VRAAPLIVAGAAGAAALLFASRARASKAVSGPFDAIYQKYGAAYGVPWQLVAAHAWVESSERPRAYNRESSSGLMQILLPIGRNLGAARHYRAGRLPEWAGADQLGDRIFDPDINVMLGASLIRENVAAYGLPRAIAVYNMDQARLAPIAGPFVNQRYVDKVIARARSLGLNL
jgi:soluble lytic murein transglycosylase-like protein